MYRTVIRSADVVRFRKFSPIDRETPIIEIVHGETTIADVARADGQDTSSEFEIGFHDGAAGLRVSVDAWMEMMRIAKGMVVAEESEEG